MHIPLKEDIQDAIHKTLQRFPKISHGVVPRFNCCGATERLLRRRLTDPVSRPHATPAPPYLHAATLRWIGRSGAATLRKRSERLSEGFPWGWRRPRQALFTPLASGGFAGGFVGWISASLGENIRRIFEVWYDYDGVDECRGVAYHLLFRPQRFAGSFLSLFCLVPYSFFADSMVSVEFVSALIANRKNFRFRFFGGSLSAFGFDVLPERKAHRMLYFRNVTRLE